MNEGLSSEERNWGMLCHISAFAFFFIPFGNIIGPLVVWLVKKEELPFVDDQGKESLNFQISVAIYGAVSAILIIVIIGIALLIGLFVFTFVVIIIGAIKSSNGEYYRYPLNMRLIK